MSGTKDIKFQTRSISHLLKRGVQYATHLYMTEAGKQGLTQRQFTVLNAIDANEGKSQTDLVKITGIDRSTLADLVSRLMEQGYLQRRRSKDDARANTVRLTPVGKKALKSVQGAADEVDKALLAQFSLNDRKTVMACLADLSAKMDDLDQVQPEKVSNGKVRLRRKV
jgi:DNA-binding MarR family transcriptional regulator